MSEDLRRQLTEAQAREEKATLLLLETARHLDCDDLDAIPAMTKRQLAEARAEVGRLETAVRVVHATLGKTLNDDFGWWSQPGNANVRGILYPVWEVCGEALAAPAPEDPISKLAKTFGPPQTLSEAYAAQAPTPKREARAARVPAQPSEPLAEGREHLTASGKFRSDKYPWCHDGFVPLKVTDPMASDLLAEYARRRQAVDAQFSRDLSEALTATAPEPIVAVCPATPEGTPLVKTDDRKPTPKSETKRRVVEAAKKWHVDRSLSVRHGRESSETLYEELMGACEALAAQQQGGS